MTTRNRITPSNTDWRDSAACAGMDTDAFFTVIQCAKDAINVEDYAGVRGGIRISQNKGTRTRSIAKLWAVAAGRASD